MGKKLIVVLALIALAITGFVFDLHSFFSFEKLKASQSALQVFQASNALLFGSVFFAVYVLATALSVPGAGTILTLAGGALFGFWQGLALVSFASTIGATIAFLLARFLAQDFVQRRFADRFEKINNGFLQEGGFYLFTMRLVPLFPFFIVNILMGLTPIKTRTYYWVSQLGMLPGTAVYVNAGTQLATLEGLRDIASSGLVASFVLLGIFPLLAKKTLAWFSHHYRNKKNPAL